MTATGQSLFKKPPVSTADVGVQTMSTSIPRFPVVCRSHPVPWGLDTDEPSPLVYNNSLDHIYTDKKRKLEDSTASWGASTCTPRKMLAFCINDLFHLNHLFDFLKSPISKKAEAHNDVLVNEEVVSESPIICEYEGLVMWTKYTSQLEL